MIIKPSAQEMLIEVIKCQAVTTDAIIKKIFNAEPVPGGQELMTWEQQHALCEAGNLEALNTELDREQRPIERDVFYISSVNMSCDKHPRVAVSIGLRYASEFSKSPEPFGAGRKPDALVLKRLVMLLNSADCDSEDEYVQNLEAAIKVCKLAIANDLADGTKKGFQGRLKKLEQSCADTKWDE